MSKKFIVVREDKSWWIRDAKLRLIAVGLSFQHKDRAEEVAALLEKEASGRLNMRYVPRGLDAVASFVEELK